MIKEEKLQGRISREKSGSFNNHDTVPKTAIFKGFSTLSGFWRKSSHGLGIFDSLKWKLRLSLKSPRKPHVREKSGTHFFNFFCKRHRIFWMILSVLGQFLGFGWSDGLHIAYLDSTRCWQQFGADIAHVGSFKSRKNAFLNDPKCQKGGFLDLGLLDRLDIAYNDRTKWGSMLRNRNSSLGIVQ